VFTSDHGYTLGAHGLDEILTPYEECVRVPLLMRYPRKWKPRVEHGVVSHVDLARLEMKRRPAVFSEGPDWRMVATRTGKLVVDAQGKPTHLYDLERDPYELTNLVATEGRTRERLLRLLKI
jgi:arylsulfatase A-like enzyme